MGSGETHGLGYEWVDDDPNVAVLIETMDTTARWDSTCDLRTWERHQLGLGSGQRLLDVGVVSERRHSPLPTNFGGSGEVVGVDASATTPRVARERAAAAKCRVRFSVGDALALDEPDSCFDAARPSARCSGSPIQPRP